MVSPQNRLSAPRAPGDAPGPGTIPPLSWGSARLALHCCEAQLDRAPRLRARVGLRLGAGLLPPAITCVTAWLQHSSYHCWSWVKPLGLSAILAVSSTLPWELWVKLQLPTKAVLVETPHITFA